MLSKIEKIVFWWPNLVTLTTCLSSLKSLLPYEHISRRREGKKMLCKLPCPKSWEKIRGKFKSWCFLFYVLSNNMLPRVNIYEFKFIWCCTILLYVCEKPEHTIKKSSRRINTKVYAHMCLYNFVFL